MLFIIAGFLFPSAQLLWMRAPLGRYRLIPLRSFLSPGAAASQFDLA
jgi:hypothetical protein